MCSNAFGFREAFKLDKLLYFQKYNNLTVFLLIDLTFRMLKMTNHLILEQLNVSYLYTKLTVRKLYWCQRVNIILNYLKFQDIMIYRFHINICYQLCKNLISRIIFKWLIILNHFKNICLFARLHKVRLILLIPRDSSNT